MINLDAREFPNIQSAINSVPTGVEAEILITGTFPNQQTTKLKSGICLIFKCAIVDFSAGNDVGFFVSVPGVYFNGDGRSVIQNANKSAIMGLAGADGLGVHGLEITNYNTSNSQGHSGIFLYGQGGSLIGSRVTYCNVHDGNGNGLRAQHCRDLMFLNNRVSRTLGHSSEGITAGHCSCRIEGNFVEFANTTGILFYCAEDYTDIVIINNNIKNSSQAQVGGSGAIGLNAQGYSITGVIVSGNRAWDDQKISTQSRLLTAWATTGKLQHGRVCGNSQWGCTDINDMTHYVLNPATQLVDWEEN